ncbi:MAG: Aminodeoxychorismate synthase component 1 [Alphaproteobacteria bacterium MarineAlpha5_Bin9]|nr:MAG: Aminodeoxychorismate synthase component 1 [Alphaproteobacteria bacterium MarineAlpha5_Bin9]|tara:strand:+ start:34418 stop:35620 length:1203 start_codon:yes stop_codon:yes gene_type:complete
MIKRNNKFYNKNEENLSKTYLNKLIHSDKPIIIYKIKRGYYLFSDFSEKIILSRKNINQFFIKVQNQKNKKHFGYVGFFGYEILCNLIGIKIIKQKNNSFPMGIFYKPKNVIFLKESFINNYSLKIKHSSSFKVNLSLKNYTKVFNKFVKKIKNGETYQIKICQKYINKSKINSFSLFVKLMKTNPSPEAFFIRDTNYSIISCSPETLIERKNDILITKPIAGTMKKNKKSSLAKAKKYFKNNIKESKEHNMIVDMERNDLSKICKNGTVKIKKLKYIEEYKDLYHCITKISGILKKNISTKKIIQAMMPGGSVIGCPKINTLNLLNNYEIENRNIFTGSFGYIKTNLDMRFNVIIRSILHYKGKSEISAASGVVVGSKAKAEYNENYIKAKSLINLFKK